MLKAGEKAPSFSLPSDAGKDVRLSDYAGRTLIVYFYPRDNTPGCTRESIGFSEAIDRFVAAGAAVVGVSRDSVASHCSFRDKHGLRIPLLSDKDLTVHRAFGAWGEKTMYGKKVEGTIRSTFVIDPGGVVTKVFPSVKVDGHVDAVLAALGGGASAGETKKASPAKKAPAAKKAVTAKKAPAPKKAVAAKKAPAPKKAVAAKNAPVAKKAR
jgi:peroxiredoxin Q/BCP